MFQNSCHESRKCFKMQKTTHHEEEWNSWQYLKRSKWKMFQNSFHESRKCFKMQRTTHSSSSLGLASFNSQIIADNACVCFSLQCFFFLPFCPLVSFRLRKCLEKENVSKFATFRGPDWNSKDHVSNQVSKHKMFQNSRPFFGQIEIFAKTISQINFRLQNAKHIQSDRRLFSFLFFLSSHKTITRWAGGHDRELRANTKIWFNFFFLLPPNTIWLPTPSHGSRTPMKLSGMDSPTPITL
jgi:hypothetical protein